MKTIIKGQRPYNSCRAWWNFIKSTDKAYMYGELPHDYFYPYIAISKDWNALTEGPTTDKPCSYMRIKKSDLMPDVSNIGILVLAAYRQKHHTPLRHLPPKTTYQQKQLPAIRIANRPINATTTPLLLEAAKA